jgi:hypothetical protein
MSGTYFINYETSGGWKAFINPECISHIYPKCGLTIVVMINGYEYTFDGPMEDFLNRLRNDIAEANRDII